MRERRGTSGDLRLLAGNHEAEAELYPWHKYYHLIVIRAVTEYLLTLSSCKEFGVTALISPWNFFHWGYQVLEIGLRLELKSRSVFDWKESIRVSALNLRRFKDSAESGIATYAHDIYDSVEDMGRSVIFQQNSEFYLHLLQCPFKFSQLKFSSSRYGLIKQWLRMYKKMRQGIRHSAVINARKSSPSNY